MGSFWKKVVKYADPRTHVKAVRSLESNARDLTKRVHSRENLKRVGREAIAAHAVVEPYVAGTAVFLASVFLTPAVGAVIGAAAIGGSYYVGATAARHKGEMGAEARDAGRDQRRHVTNAVMIGMGAGTVASIAVGALAAPAAGAGEAALLAGEAGAINSANLSATALAAAPEAIAITGSALPSLVAPAVITPIASTGGFWATLGGIGTTILGVAGPVLQAVQSLLPAAYKDPAPMPDGTVIGSGAGAGGAAGVGEALGSDPLDEPLSFDKLPTAVKVVGAVGITLLGLAAGKALRKVA